MSVNIRNRRAWGAQFTVPAGRHVAPAQRRFFVVHWPGGPVGSDIPAVIRSIERFHRVNQGWAAAPGYNFLVGPGGTIFEGCGRDVRGIHSAPRNTDGFGVCVLIAPGQPVPQAARNATRALYEWLCQVSGRRLNMSWHGQHVATACPGPALTQWVRNGMPANVPGGGGGGGGGGSAPRFPGRLLRQPPVMRGEDVRTFQAQLNRRGWGSVMGAIDGAYGPRTANAVRGFQRNQRITCDGIVGPVTWPRAWSAGAGGPIRGGCR
jgi:hypothetical protein